ncbi:hypothetical protein Pint_19160 [Pistacia integerrima]|uniref:Uncharacterized protein n=1 Tax=Pistacia integerrima TaxID=434235 RepID=A0ACC0YXG7_9ROSI|nr:hypothetical protein Pint_19160 [Pistacia integerrima]
MENIASKIIRTSIFTFLKHFQFFTTTPLLVLLPFSASSLLSQSLLKSPAPISTSLFIDIHASCFQNLSHQTILIQLFTLPFTIASLLLSKASIIQALSNPQKPFTSLCWPLILTQLCNLALISTIKMVAFSIFSLALSYDSIIFLSLGSVFFSGLLTNMVVIGNLALVVAAMENNSKGYLAIYKAYCMLLRKGKKLMVLVLALPANLGLGAMEALFEYRVIRVYHNSLGKISAFIAFEGILIAYLYSLLLVLDTIACCLFYKSCLEDDDQSDDDVVFVQKKEYFRSASMNGFLENLQLEINLGGVHRNEESAFTVNEDCLYDLGIVELL